MSEEESLPPVGRGRGRGGGVPLLPSGMWDSLNGNVGESKNFSEQVEDRAANIISNEELDAEIMPNIPTVFIGGRGMGGRGRGRGDGRGRGGRGGMERDAKGKDWECPSCTNVNWSWRSTCNKCNTGKPNSTTADEHRDGAGGGFNERQNRASAAAVEIDDEGFDDFGRRVKKLKRADKQAKEEAALNRLNEKYKHLLPTGTIGGSGGDWAGESSHTASAGVMNTKYGNGNAGRNADDDRLSSSGNTNGFKSNTDGRYDDADEPVQASRGSGRAREDHDDRRPPHNDNDRHKGSAYSSNTHASSDRNRDRSRDRDRESDRHRDRDGTHAPASGHRDQERHNDSRGHKDRERERDTGRDSAYSSGRRDRDEGDRHRGRGSSRDRGYEGDRHHDSSSRDARDSYSSKQQQGRYESGGGYNGGGRR